MCGCTCVGSPACTARRFSRERSWLGVSHVLQSSQDLRGVQELLGHANITTTQVYTRLDFQHLARAYDAAHPRARRKP